MQGTDSSARGWSATKSSGLAGDVRGTTDWTKVDVDYVTLADAKAIEILARRLEGGDPVTGKAGHRIESVRKFQPENSRAVPDLGVNNAKRKDGTITVMIVNKNIVAARAWVLSGPSPIANNLQTPDAIGVHEAPVQVREDAYFLEMPACSMAAVEISP